MSTRSNRRNLLLGSLPIAVLVAVASTAYACTIFKGTMTVQGNGRNPAVGHPTAVTVKGNNRGMGYCDSPTLPVTSRDLPADTGYTYVGNSAPPANSVDISVAPSTGNCASQLPDGVYDVNFTNGPAFTNVGGVRAWDLDCMFGDDPGNVNVGTMTVSGGVGSGQYNLGANLTSNGPGDESAVCVSNQPPRRGLFGLQAPVTVL